MKISKPELGGKKHFFPLIICVIFYACAIGYLVIAFGFNPANNMPELGQTGDFIGGLLNPLIGIVTIALLASTLRINHQLHTDTVRFYELERFSHGFYLRIELLSRASEKLQENVKFINHLKNFCDGGHRQGLNVEISGGGRVTPITYLRTALRNSHTGVAIAKSLINDLCSTTGLTSVEMNSYVGAIKASIGDEILIPLAIDLFANPDTNLRIFYEQYAFFELATLQPGYQADKYGANLVFECISPMMCGAEDNSPI